ncbi:MAG TPA: hypothetical protein VHH53_05750 [Pseudonocardiaceae bacterium]|nr:hypothetical protein [Pseudonocardiaceae bacterium]
MSAATVSTARHAVIIGSLRLIGASTVLIISRRHAGLMQAVAGTVLWVEIEILVEGGRMDANGYVTFLLVGVALIVIDGQLIARSGRGYLQRPQEGGPGRSMVRLVSALFYLVMLGLLALISLINVDTGLPVRDLVVKLGVLLLVLAAVHGLTIAILLRIKDRRLQEQMTEGIAESRYSQGVQGPTVHPVNDGDNGGNRSSSTESRW